MNKKIKTTVKKAYKAIKHQDIEAYGSILEDTSAPANIVKAFLYLLAILGSALAVFSFYQLLW